MEIPLQALTGHQSFSTFSFCEPVYCKVDENELDHRVPSQSIEKRGHWVGFDENNGDQLTWKIPTMKPNKSLPDLLSEVLPRLLQISGWTRQKGRINHKI